MSTETRAIVEGMFESEDLRKAAVCIDHFVMTTLESTNDFEVKTVLVDVGSSILTMIKSLDLGMSVDDIIVRIDRASESAKETVMLEVIAAALGSQRGEVL